MSRRKKQEAAVLIPVQEESFSPAAVQEPACSNCPYFRKKNDKYGECRRRVSNFVNSNFLTEFGPLGNFIIMQGDSLCGEHPDYLSRITNQ